MAVNKDVLPAAWTAGGDLMETPEDVVVMLRLKGVGWGAKRIAFELGCSRNTVKRYLRRGAWVPYQRAYRRGALDGLEVWLCERLRQHRGNADVVRQELEREHGIRISLRPVERAVCDFRRELEAEERACVRFETPPGRQLQIAFGSTWTSIGDEIVRVFLFVATLGYSRRGFVAAFGMNARAHGSMVWKRPSVTSAASRRRC
jgi:transposase